MNTKSHAFTLIELLVVVGIIAMLSAIVLSSLSTSRQKSRDTIRVQNIKQIQNALELYRNASGSYPANQTALTAALVPTHIPSIPTDPLASLGGLCRPNYCYYANSSFGYHLGAQLERTDSKVLGSDADAVDSNSTEDGDFDGSLPNIYDVRP